jgi:hypothetical protein
MILRQNEPSCYAGASRIPSPGNLPSERFRSYAAEVVLCDVSGKAPLSHSLPLALADWHLT